MPKTAGLTVVLDWDDAKVKKGVADLNKMFQGGLGNLAVDNSGVLKSTKGATDAIGALRKEVNLALRETQNLTIVQGANAQATLREQTVYASLKDKLDSVTRSSKNTIDAYGRLADLAARATRHAQNLAAAYGVNSDRATVAADRAKKLNEQLAKIDANSGRYNRNVGNYASGYNAISTSISRIVGEMPNFTQSLRIGFMAISNNIQPLAEDIKRLNVQNKELAAQGKPTTSALKQVGAALFGWNTLLLVGVSLLTAYGPKLVEWVQGLSAGSRAAKLAKEETEALNKAQEGSNQQAGKQIGTLSTLNNVLQSNTASAKAKKGAYDQLVKLYPSYADQLNDEYKRTGQVANVIKNVLVPAIIAAAQARALQSRIDDLAAKSLDAQTKQIAIARKQNLAAAKEAVALARAGGEPSLLDIEQGNVDLDLIKAQNEVKGLKNEWRELQGVVTNNTKSIQSYADQIVKTTPKMGNLTSEGIDAGKYANKVKSAATENDKLSDAIAKVNKELSGLETKKELKQIGEFEYLTEVSKTLNAGVTKLTETFNVPANNSVLLAWSEQATIARRQVRALEMAFDGLGNKTTKTDIWSTLESLRDGPPTDTKFKDLQKSITPQWDKIFDKATATEEIKDYTGAINKQIGEATKQTIQTSKQLNEAFASLGSGMLESIGSGIGNALSGGSFTFVDVLDNILDLIGQFIVDYGKQLIKVGALMVAAGTLTSEFGGGVLIAKGKSNIIAGGLLVVGGSVLKAIDLGKKRRPFASGGLVYGRTDATLGEYPGAANNPEFVAPLDKAKAMFKEVAGGGAVQVYGRLDGRDILLSGERTKQYLNR